MFYNKNIRLRIIILILIIIIFTVFYYSIRIIPLRNVYYNESIVDISNYIVDFNNKTLDFSYNYDFSNVFVNYGDRYDICYALIEPSMNDYLFAVSLSKEDLSNNIFYNYYNLDNKEYNYDNVMIEYHEDPNVIANSQGMPFGSMVVLDTSGNRVVMTNSNIKNRPIYYDPYNMKYSMNNYVPNYKDSIYLRNPYSISTRTAYYTSK